MLKMLLIMTSIGTALMTVIIAALEWRALRGFWRLKRGSPANLPIDHE
jgi:hypothetical protein